MEINHVIEHTNLEMNASIKDIELLCNEAIKYCFSTICVAPYYAGLAKEILKETNITVSSVIGYPYGYSGVQVKSYEAIELLNDKVDEIGLVINHNAIKNEDFDYIKSEIEEIRDSIDGKILKVIINLDCLNKTEILKIKQICCETFIHYLEIYSSKSLKVEDVNYILESKTGVLEIKINNDENIIEFIEAGVSKIGTTKSVSIMES